ncbi:hypothetical protein [Fimbriimonas ginsengisoli]|uniref:FeoB-associated Cys-rich membrane protein n=1 Tax=Fimbriimonas ginsengisoli Gsoil 348 TaxID=661478 RepID=A0A068NLY9_FIMGI|nr:hypothetical protein [Fimbriimonas ginsengisoli]AIE83800.1 hypothetical protein OP10G_0432 [Fimbriimonas ginsengisoli Gsoil 348]
MEIVIVGTVLALCIFFIGRHMLRSLGLGIGGGKPDCGCGSCAAKKKRGTR